MLFKKQCNNSFKSCNFKYCTYIEHILKFKMFFIKYFQHDITIFMLYYILQCFLEKMVIKPVKTHFPSIYMSQ